MNPVPDKIVQIRQWIVVCEAAGIGVPDQIYLLDAYARLLESRIAELVNA